VLLVSILFGYTGVEFHDDLKLHPGKFETASKQ
jgi:hypothetical protein